MDIDIIFFFPPILSVHPGSGHCKEDAEHSNEDDAGGFPGGLLVRSESLDDIGDGRTKAKRFPLHQQLREHVCVPQLIPGPHHRRVLGRG